MSQKANSYQYKKLTFIKLTNKPVEDFLKRLFLSDIKISTLIIITPIMGTLTSTRFSLERLRKKIEEDKIFTYLITRKPEEKFHSEAVDIFMQSDMTEIRFNNSLHAKIYICIGRETGFGLLGSGNLTTTSIQKNVEIGMLIFGREQGKELLNELYHWGSVRLRTLQESKLVKRITYSRR